MLSCTPAALDQRRERMLAEAVQPGMATLDRQASASNRSRWHSKLQATAARRSPACRFISISIKLQTIQMGKCGVQLPAEAERLGADLAHNTSRSCTQAGTQATPAARWQHTSFHGHTNLRVRFTATGVSWCHAAYTEPSAGLRLDGPRVWRHGRGTRLQGRCNAAGQAGWQEACETMTNTLLPEAPFARESHSARHRRT